MIATALFTPTMTCGSAQIDPRNLPHGKGERVQFFAFIGEHPNALEHLFLSGAPGGPNQVRSEASVA
jgi:hypothetical protein